MSEIFWIILSHESTQYEAVAKALGEKAGLIHVGSSSNSYPVALDCAQAHLANLVLIDLRDPATDSLKYWLALQLAFPAAQYMGLVDQPIREASLLAALQSGVHCFAAWSDSAERWLEAIETVFSGRRFYSTPWLITVAQKVIKEFETDAHPRQDLSTNFLQFQISRFRLSPLEANLFGYLFHHKSKVISPHDLAREVWQQASVVDVYDFVNCGVRRLRRKLAVDQSQQFQIQTVRGQGYRLVEQNG